MLFKRQEQTSYKNKLVAHSVNKQALHNTRLSSEKRQRWKYYVVGILSHKRVFPQVTAGLAVFEQEVEDEQPQPEWRDSQTVCALWRHLEAA